MINRTAKSLTLSSFDWEIKFSLKGFFFLSLSWSYHWNVAISWTEGNQLPCQCEIYSNYWRGRIEETPIERKTAQDNVMEEKVSLLFFCRTTLAKWKYLLLGSRSSFVPLLCSYFIIILETDKNNVSVQLHHLILCLSYTHLLSWLSASMKNELLPLI